MTSPIGNRVPSPMSSTPGPMLNRTAGRFRMMFALPSRPATGHADDELVALQCDVSVVVVETALVDPYRTQLTAVAGESASPRD